MSGGGGGAPAATQGSEVYGRAPTVQTFQPTLPGFQDMLVNQLSRGFGGGQTDLASLLSDLYKPMNVYKFQEPIAQTAEEYKKTNSGDVNTKYAPISTGNPALDKLLMGR